MDESRYWGRGRHCSSLPFSTMKTKTESNFVLLLRFGSSMWYSTRGRNTTRQNPFWATFKFPRHPQHLLRGSARKATLGAKQRPTAPAVAASQITSTCLVFGQDQYLKTSGFLNTHVPGCSIATDKTKCRTARFWRNNYTHSVDAG